MADIGKFLQIRSNKIPPVPGRILIAEPLMRDSWFSRSVIYLVSNDESGAFGLLLNSPTGKVVKDLDKYSALPEMPVYWGGPVDEATLFFLHTFGNAIPNAYPVANGIYCGGDWNVVEQMAKENMLNVSNFKIFGGYAGWTENQLSDEITNNAWAVSSIDANTLFELSAEQIWRKAVSDLGTHYKHWLLMPPNPDLN